MSDPGVTTWTTTRLQLISALRDRTVLASRPLLTGDEALAAIADAILACLPEAGGGPEKALAGAERIIAEKDAEIARLKAQSVAIGDLSRTGHAAVQVTFLRQVLTDAIRACEQDVMADGEAMQGLLAEYRAELAGLPAVTL